MIHVRQDIFAFTEVSSQVYDLIPEDRTLIQFQFKELIYFLRPGREGIGGM